MVTIREVAERAGVSIKTVSRVVNNTAEVSPATRQRVQQVIAELGYQPSSLARSLVRGKSDTVGVVIPLSAHFIFSRLFFTEVLRGIAEVLSDHRLDLLIYLAQDETPYIQLYRQRRVDGLILMSVPVDDPNLAGLLEGEAPCVFTCRITEHENPSWWVDADFATGVEQAVDHLVSLGHTRIGLLAGPPNLVSVHLRVKGYCRALAKHGIPVPEDLILYDDFSSEVGRTLARKLMEHPRPPTALICGDDMMALGAIQGVREMGRRVPEDVSVVGFDDVILAAYATPPLTTIRQDGYEKGRIAADLLIELMSEASHGVPRHVVLDTRLVVRHSTGPAPRDSNLDVGR
jgi:DNA-binding LacI/PurR family transcriptional regulator